jgi:hypothetical protein
MWEYNHTDTLAHHGIKGQKWGVRRFQNEDGSLTPAGERRYGSEVDYKSSKKAYKTAVKEQKRAGRNAFGIDGLKRYTDAEKNTSDAYTQRARAKAEYANAKKKSDEKGDKAEFKSYVKTVSKTGLAGSYNDRRSGGMSTAVLSDLRTRKGEEYAHRVEKKVQNRAIAQLAIGTTVSIGAGIVAGLLAMRY